MSDLSEMLIAYGSVEHIGWRHVKSLYDIKLTKYARLARVSQALYEVPLDRLALLGRLDGMKGRCNNRLDSRHAADDSDRQT